MQRIESGSLGGRRLAPLPRGVEVRPTGARIRAAIFDRLQAMVPGARVLDLFAGSGAMGFEALSRGAEHAVLVERDPRLARRLREEVARLGLRGRASVLHADVLERLSASHDGPPFDLVIVDPPYREVGLTDQVAKSLVVGGFLGPDAVLVSERLRARGEPTPVTWPAELHLDTTKTYGQTVVEFLIHTPREEAT